MFVNVQNSNLLPDASSETSVHTNTQLNLLLNRKSALIAIHIPSNDEPQMQLRTVQSDDKNPIPSDTSSSREQVCSQKGEIVTYTWSHPDRIRKSAKSKPSNIR